MANPSKIKNGPKFNIFDILIILAVLVCVGAIIFRVFFISETQEDFRHAYVTFKVEGVSEETAQAFCINAYFCRYYCKRWSSIYSDDY